MAGMFFLGRSLPQDCVPTGLVAVDAPTGVHIGLVVVTDISHVVTALKHTRERAQTYVVRGTIAADDDDLYFIGQTALFECSFYTGSHCSGILKQNVQPGDTPRRVGILRCEGLQATCWADHYHVRTCGLQNSAHSYRGSATGAGAMARCEQHFFIFTQNTFIHGISSFKNFQDFLGTTRF
jgi:hypothetical protein